MAGPSNPTAVPPPPKLLFIRTLSLLLPHDRSFITHHGLIPSHPLASVRRCSSNGQAVAIVLVYLTVELDPGLPPALFLSKVSVQSGGNRLHVVVPLVALRSGHASLLRLSSFLGAPKGAPSANSVIQSLPAGSSSLSIPCTSPRQFPYLSQQSTPSPYNNLIRSMGRGT